MRVVALGDAHLGRTAGPVTEHGVNRRELDFEDSFLRAVDLGLAQQPDLFVWLGDIFDKPNPTYRSYAVAQRALNRIRTHGVALVAISGNHDTPRLAGTGSPYTPLAEVFDGFHFARGLERTKLELPGLTVHCVPQMASVDATLNALAEVRAERNPDVPNLLLTHPRVPQVEPKYNDLNEITVDAAALDCDLVLLGHYHSHRTVMERIWYAGAPDAFGFADEYQDPKGIVVLDTDDGTITQVELAGRRPLVHPFPIDALGIGPDEVTAKVAAAVAETPEHAMVWVQVDGVAPEVWSQVDPKVWRAAGSHALHLRVEPRLLHAGVPVQNLPELAGVQARFEQWMEPQEVVGLDRGALVERGKEFLAAAVQDSE